MKWARDNYHHDSNSPYILRLASGDTSGNVIVWDISQGTAVTEFSEGNRPILDLEWLATQDACHDLLAVLHAPSSMILWNADTGTKLWKKTFQEALLCFAFDPFIPSNVTCKLKFYLKKVHTTLKIRVRPYKWYLNPLIRLCHNLLQHLSQVNCSFALLERIHR